MDTKEKILVVDDDKFNVSLMRELCESVGYEVIEAYDGNSAIEIITDQPPDLLLLDIMMSGKDGFEVCRELRARKETADLPIIIVTALDDLESKVRGLELGADDYVTKPFRLFELQRRVRTAIDTRRYRRQLKEAEDKLKKLGDIDTPGRIGGFRQLRCGLEYEFNRASRYDHPLSCALLSLDDYGPLADKSPKAIATVVGRVVSALKKNLRTVDRIYRMDSDQFILLLPETPIPGAKIAIERIRNELRQPTKKIAVPITITIALVGFPHSMVKTGQDILRTLSELHTAKCRGKRDCVIELEPSI